MGFFQHKHPGIWFNFVLSVTLCSNSTSHFETETGLTSHLYQELLLQVSQLWSVKVSLFSSSVCPDKICFVDGRGSQESERGPCLILGKTKEDESTRVKDQTKG